MKKKKEARAKPGWRKNRSDKNAARRHMRVQARNRGLKNKENAGNLRPLSQDETRTTREEIW
jgi:hypothetical protein